jgi:aminoglycoside phosphotransferase family enzyme
MIVRKLLRRNKIRCCTKTVELPHSQQPKSVQSFKAARPTDSKRCKCRMAVTDPATLHFLRHPNTHRSVSGVKVIETHMSWVFLAGQVAFKLKKPLCSDYLDFRSVDTRCRACHEELRLNRRLAPDVYLGVETISQDADGRFRFGGGGKLVDCVVRMRRLPEHVMLSTQLVQGALAPGVMEDVATCIAQFHRSLPALRPLPAAWRKVISEAIDSNAAALLSCSQCLPTSEVLSLCQLQRNFLLSHAAWIDARIHQGCMVEGHGDLRAEHVFISDTVGAIDCLEFSALLRQLDRVDEIGFLALDCERLGGEAAAKALLQHYQVIANDYPPPALLHFYQSLRAAVRARLAIVRVSEQSHRPSQAWVDRAQRWLQLAIKHGAAMRLNQPCISSTMDPPS